MHSPLLTVARSYEHRRSRKVHLWVVVHDGCTSQELLMVSGMLREGRPSICLSRFGNDENSIFGSLCFSYLQATRAPLPALRWFKWCWVIFVGGGFGGRGRGENKGLLLWTQGVGDMRWEYGRGVSVGGWEEMFGSVERAGACGEGVGRWRNVGQGGLCGRLERGGGGCEWVGKRELYGNWTEMGRSFGFCCLRQKRTGESWGFFLKV